MTREQWAMEKLVDLMEKNQDVLFRLKNDLTEEEKCDTIDIEKERKRGKEND